MPGSVERTIAALRRALDGEVGRRLVHASGSAIPALYLLEFATWRQVQLLFVACALGAGVLELLRLSAGLDWRIYDRLTREYEQDNPAGYAYYVLSTAAVALAFDPRVAVPAILMLMLGDPVSGVVSSDEIREVKRPAALGTMFAVCVAIALPFLSDAPLAVALGSVAATAADGVKPTVDGYVVDDNLTIPPAAAIGMQAGIALTALLL
jgi:dolichol kinase